MNNPVVKEEKISRAFSVRGSLWRHGWTFQPGPPKPSGLSGISCQASVHEI